MTRSQVVAANIKAARKSLGLSQAQAGDRLSVTQQTWAQYESGEYNIGVDTVEQIARVLETSTEILMGLGKPLPKVQSPPARAKKKAG